MKRRPIRTCAIDDCDKPVLTRGWCNMHYLRWYRHGDPFRGRPSLQDRLPQLVEVTPFGCWSWLGTKNRAGYGLTYSRTTSSSAAHRIVYMELVGPIPDGLVIDHLCRNTSCVNPDHLEPVTTRENNLRGQGFAARNSMKTKCDKGHEYTPENTYVTTDGRRNCRKCRAANSRRYYSKKGSS